MKILIANIRQKMMVQLSEVIFNSKQSGTYLNANTWQVPFPNIWVIISGIIFCFIMAENEIWQGFYLYIIFGGLLAFLISKQAQKWIRWRNLGRDSVFFDPFYFYSIKGSELEIIPLSDYLYADILLSIDGYNYLARFHFKGKTILQACASKNDDNTLNFQNKVSQYSNILKQSPEANKVPRYLSGSLADKLNSNINPIIIAGFVVLSIFFTLPIIIDSNQYKKAVEANTASSYRSYLSIERNIRHRDEARTSIKGIYNKYINNYKTQTIKSQGASAFQKVLEYLRDRDLYTLSMIFTSKSELIDIPRRDLNIIFVTPSFTTSKNISRENEVVSTLRLSLGAIFPNDIVSLANEDKDELPKLEVYYTYKNNRNSLYYSEKEETISEQERTWYYGIEIIWYFKLFIPTQKSSLYEFSLVSKPALRFTSETNSPSDIYNNMAVSAFTDFSSEFRNQFLN